MNQTVAGFRALLVPADTALPVTEIVIADAGDNGRNDLVRRIRHADLIEHVRGPRCSLWIDESGAVTDPPQPSNPRIDRLLARPDGWSIRGNVVITGQVDAEGGTCSLPVDDAARLLNTLTAEPR